MCIVASWAQLGSFKPAGRKFIPAVRHVFAAKNIHGQHLFGCQLGLELIIEIRVRCFHELIRISLLHEIINNRFYNSVHHSWFKIVVLGWTPVVHERWPIKIELHLKLIFSLIQIMLTARNLEGNYAKKKTKPIKINHKSSSIR